LGVCVIRPHGGVVSRAGDPRGTPLGDPLARRRGLVTRKLNSPGNAVTVAKLVAGAAQAAIDAD